MAQKTFKMNKNEQYIECHRPFMLPNGKYSGMIRVYELLNPAKQNMLTTMDWSFEPVIIDPNATTGYNSLDIDGQLVDLEKLVHDLCKSRLRVNKLGYCYFQVRQGVADTTETYGFAFYRMNDVLKWSDYGVMPKQGNPNPMNWDRLDILHGGTSDVKEIYQKENDYQTMLDELKSQIQKLTTKNAELQAQLEVNVSKQSPLRPAYYVPVAPTLFNFVRSPDYPHKYETILHHWETTLYNFGTYTPTYQAVSGEMYRKVTFRIKQDQGFDTNNWFFVAVKELNTPILIYEGTAHSVTVAASTVSSPIDGSAMIQYSAEDDVIHFGRIIINGVGVRIGIRLR